MKGLVITLGIMLAFVAIGVGVSAYVYVDLENDLENSQKSGFEEGYAQGYNQGLNDGHEAGYQEGSLVGFQAGQDDEGDGDISGAYFLYNPTFSEVEGILQQSGLRTAKDLHDFAEVNGYRAAYVRCPIAREAREGRIFLYQLVAFETVDMGMVIIEPKSHYVVEVEVGQSFSGLNGLKPVDYDDTITKVTVVW